MSTMYYESGDVGGEAYFHNKQVGIVVAEWNAGITGALQKGAAQYLQDKGVPAEQIITKYVPGSFELSLGAQRLAAEHQIDGVICLGCVIKGETPHFDYICQAVSYGITEVGLKYNKPVIFGVLTTNDMAQAEARAGGKLGNKGGEAALSLLKMFKLFHEPLL